MSHIKAQDEFGNAITAIKSNFNTNDIILHFENYPALGIDDQGTKNEKTVFITVSPNPTSGNCVFDFRLERTSFIKLELLDILGNVVKLVANKNFNEGWQQIELNTTEFKPGIYFYRLSVDDTKPLVKKLIISR